MYRCFKFVGSKNPKICGTRDFSNLLVLRIHKIVVHINSLRYFQKIAWQINWLFHQKNTFPHATNFKYYSNISTITHTYIHTFIYDEKIPAYTPAPTYLHKRDYAERNIHLYLNKFSVCISHTNTLNSHSNTHTYAYTYVHTFKCVHIYIYSHIYVCIYIYMYLHMYSCIYRYIYVHTPTH